MTFDVKSAIVALILVGVILGFVAVRESSAQHSQSGGGGGGGDSTRDLIAVTGSYGSGASVLYLIDAKTRHMAVYRTENGKRLELVAARDVGFDLKLESYNDQSEAGFTPRELRKSWTEILRGGGATSRPTESDATLPGGGR